MWPSPNDSLDTSKDCWFLGLESIGQVMEDFYVQLLLSNARNTENFKQWRTGKTFKSKAIGKCVLKLQEWV